MATYGLCMVCFRDDHFVLSSYQDSGKASGLKSRSETILVPIRWNSVVEKPPKNPTVMAVVC